MDKYLAIILIMELHVAISMCSWVDELRERKDRVKENS
jgi:hypothetical protein